MQEIIDAEKKFLSTLHCAFIREFYYSFQTQKKYYMVMEYIEGDQFDSFITNKGKLSEDCTMYYAAEIIFAVDYLHKNEILCRNLKTKNLRINQNEHIKLNSIECFKKINSLNKNLGDEISGYTAPEVILNNNYTKASDWWSLVDFT